MPRYLRRPWACATSPARVCCAAIVLTLATGFAAAQPDTLTSGVFSRHADRVIKIHVVEVGSAAKAQVGTGFFASPDGHVITNYHVIADLVHAPDRYIAELVDDEGQTHAATVDGIDVVHDLAVLATGMRPPSHFELAPATVPQGSRLYSLGHPSDLGLSIVEGTYNGHLRHTLYPKIHFTGSLNSGMSGGPTITDDGRVVGVNVSTAGNQLSFLVPVERAAALLERVRTAGEPVPTGLEEVGRQLGEYQNAYLQDIFEGDTTTVEVGGYQVVTQPAPFFRCWADSDRRPERPYESVQHSCTTDDRVFIAGDQQAGLVSLSHQVMTSRTLNALRFYSLYTSVFALDTTPYGAEEHVTSWRCGTRNVSARGVPMRTVLCVRRYRKLGELYDGVLKVALLGRPDSGLISTLSMSGVSYDNMDRLARTYLERISWR